MKIRLFISVCVVIVAMFFLVTSVSAQTTNGEDDVITTTTVSNGSDDSAGFAEVQNATVTTTISNGDDDIKTVIVTTPVTTTTYSGGGGSSSHSRTATPVSADTVLYTTSCPLITSNILKSSLKNDASDVARLQAFLKDVEKMNVAVNGSFDADTEAAVKAFQIKYADVVLAPWSATKASGIAYITTIKKINDIACKQPMTLSASELAIITAYGTKTPTVSGSTEGSSSVDLSNTEVGSTKDVTSDSDANVAASAKAPVLKRFWNFMTGLFR
jgi:hypothetical protein